MLAQVFRNLEITALFSRLSIDIRHILRIHPLLLGCEEKYKVTTSCLKLFICCIEAHSKCLQLLICQQIVTLIICDGVIRIYAFKEQPVIFSYNYSRIGRRPENIEFYIASEFYQLILIRLMIGKPVFKSLSKTGVACLLYIRKGS